MDTPTLIALGFQAAFDLIAAIAIYEIFGRLQNHLGLFRDMLGLWERHVEIEEEDATSNNE